MSITITKEAFAFSELDSDSQDKAIEQYRNRMYEFADYAWSGDNEASLRAFEAIFPIKVKDWSYGGCGQGSNYIEFDMTCDDEVADLQGLRLSKYLWNNYRRELYKGKYYSLPHNRVIKHKRVKSKKFDNGNVHNAYYSAINLEHSCVLTGYCLDEDLLDCVYALLDWKDHKSLSYSWQETSFEQLMKDCLDAWVTACASDYDYQFTDEAIREQLEQDDECIYDAKGELI